MAKQQWIVFLLLLTSLCQLAVAEASVKPLAAKVRSDSLLNTSVNARLYASSGDLISVELIIPEVYDRAEIEALSIGDSLFTRGQNIIVESVSETNGYIVLNEGDYEFSDGSVWLFETTDGDYMIADWDDNTWTSLGTLELPLSQNFLFLDHIDPESGNTLSLPAVHGASDFLSMLGDEDAAPGFTSNNVFVVFDACGELAIVERYYVPWQ